MFLCKSGFRAFGFRALIFGFFRLRERGLRLMYLLKLCYIATHWHKHIIGFTGKNETIQLIMNHVHIVSKKYRK